MGWEINIIVFLQSLSSGFLDAVMMAITLLGEETIFLIVAVIIYWCGNKRFGYKFACIYLLGTSLNEGVKSIFARPRPYTLGNIRSIGAETSGFSFPSGHSQASANMATQLIVQYRKNYTWITPVCITATLLVMLSRMYLGQHYLTDVLVGACFGITLAVLFSWLFELLKDKEENIMYVIAPIAVILTGVLMAIGKAEALGVVLKVCGGFSAFTLGYYIEKKFIKYETTKSLLKNFVKVLIGLAVALLLKDGLKLILPHNIAFLYEFVRYFLVAIWVTVGCMLFFKKLKL